MELLYFKGNPPNFGDELNWYIFESLFVESDFKHKEPKTYFMGVGSILHSAYLERFAGEKADTVSYGGRKIKMNKAVIFGSGVREHSLDFDHATLDFRFVRGPISSQQTGIKHITDAAYLLPFLKEHAYILALSKKYKISLIPYFHHAFVLDYEKISAKTGVNVIQPYKNVYEILREVRQSGLVISGAMHGCIAADIYRVPWLRLRFKTHEANHVVQTIKWRDFAESMELDRLSTIRMMAENKKEICANTELESELIMGLNSISKYAPNMSDDRVFAKRIEQLSAEVISFSNDYSIAINTKRSVISQ